MGDLSIETAGETSRLTIRNIDGPQAVAERIRCIEEAWHQHLPPRSQERASNDQRAAGRAHRPDHGVEQGTGKAMALALAAEGARVALVARSRQQLEAVAAEIAGLGGEARVFPGDVTDEARVAELERGRELVGSVRILINNAGINIRKPLPNSPWRNGRG